MKSALFDLVCFGNNKIENGMWPQEKQGLKTNKFFYVFLNLTFNNNENGIPLPAKFWPWWLRTKRLVIIAKEIEETATERFCVVNIKF